MANEHREKGGLDHDVLPGDRRPKWRILQATLAGIAIGSLIPSVIPPKSYRQDIQVPYLMATALREGTDIYAPLTELSTRHFPEPTENFPHPSPHPPFMALLAVPLTYLPYALIPPALLCLNVTALIRAGAALRLSWQASLALMAWPPIWCLLAIGQLEALLLASLLVAWQHAEEGRDFSAGGWIGFWGALKLYPLVYLLPFVLRPRLRLLLGAAVVFGAAQGANLALLGSHGLGRYYLQILPGVADRYSSLALNSAPYGTLLRVFGGADDVPPLLPAPGLVLPLTALLSVGGILSLAWLDPRASPVAGLVTLPNVWYYHAVLALPQALTILRSKLWTWGLVASIAASMTTPLANLLLGALSSVAHQLGFSTGWMLTLLMCTQTVGFLAWFALSLVLRSDHLSASGTLRTKTRATSSS